jgi:hypothetical protein
MRAWLRRPERLRRQLRDDAAVPSPVVEPSRTARGEVVPGEGGEEPVVVPDQELARVNPDVVVVPAVQDRVAQCDDREHRLSGLRGRDRPSNGSHGGRLGRPDDQGDQGARCPETGPGRLA